VNYKFHQLDKDILNSLKPIRCKINNGLTRYYKKKEDPDLIYSLGLFCLDLKILQTVLGYTQEMCEKADTFIRNFFCFGNSMMSSGNTM
jgi:DNA-binding protein Fis